MVSYNWFKIFNKTEFEASGLVSKTYSYALDGIGDKNILVTKSNLVSVTYEGIMLSLNLYDSNPFKFESHAIYMDASNDVWLGLPVEN